MDSNVNIEITAVDKAKAVIASVSSHVSSLSKTIGTVKDRLDTLQPTFQKMSIAGGVAMGAISLGAKKAIKSASDLGESINAVQVVFGAGSDKILAFGETAAKSVALSNAAFNQLSTQTGSLLRDTGLSLDQVADKTIELTKRAADMASVHNTSVEDALSAINQALRGETEAIRRYSGNVTDAELQTHLFSKGIQVNVSDLTEQEKRLLRMEVVLKQTAVTAGDFQNTIGSVANQSRVAGAASETLSASLGKILLPTVQILQSKLIPIIDGLATWISKNPELTKTLVIVTAAGAGAVAVVGALGVAIAVLMSPVTLIAGAIAALTAAVVVVATRWETLPFMFKALLLPIKMVVDGLKGLYQILMWVGDGATWLFDKLSSVTGIALVKAKEATFDLQGTINQFVDPLAGQSLQVDNFSTSIGSLGSKSKETADKIKALKAEASGIFSDVKSDEASTNQQLAEAIIAQEQSIKDKKKQLRELDDADNAESSRRQIFELQASIKEEEAALRSMNGIKRTLRVEIEEEERRAALTDFERKIEDIQKERVVRLEAQLLRLQEIEGEIAAERTKSGAIAGAFGAAQVTMQSAISKTREVAETEAERMKKAFDRAISSMNQLGGQSSSKGSVLSSLSSRLSGRASGGPVTGRTPYIVGEVGPEVFVPNTSGNIIPNKQLAGAGTGGGITINIAGTFLDDRSAARRLGDELVAVLKQNKRL